MKKLFFFLSILSFLLAQNQKFQTKLQLNGHNDIIKDISISRDSRLIATAGNRDGRAIIWSSETGKIFK